MQPEREYFLHLFERLSQLLEDGLLLILWGNCDPSNAFNLIYGAQSNTCDLIDLFVDEQDGVLFDILEADEGVEANDVFRQ